MTETVSQSITLPLLEALDYLYENNLIIDKLWTVDKLRDPTKATKYLERETHITVKPKRIISDQMDTSQPAIENAMM